MKSSPLAKETFSDVDLVQTIKPPTPLNKRPHSTTYHLTHLVLGFLALSLSGYILSHSLTTLSTLLTLSTSLLGTTLLSLATTLPEKLLSIMSGSRGETGIFIANTAGSNIFLITLCAGVLFTSGDLESLKGSVTLFEIGWMWISSAVLLGIVLRGGRKWMGWALFGAYIAFLVLEFTVERR